MLKKIHGAIKFNQKAWLKSLVWIPSFQPSWCWYEYQGKKQVKNYSDKEFFKQMNSSVFGKTMEIATKHGDVKLLKIEKRKNYLLLEPNYRTIKFFTESLLANEMRKTQILINKSVYLSVLMLDLSKNVWVMVWLCEINIWRK